MPFPESERVIYKRNPLVDVICQVSFPRILRLETEVPVEFQESIGDEYPTLEEKRSVSLEVNIDDGAVKKDPKLIYEFISRDGAWKVVLTSGFIVLTTTKYQNWDEFSRKFEKIFTKFIQVYSPQFSTRVGLRYKDLIFKHKLGLSESSWKQLFRPPISGILDSGEIDDKLIVEHTGKFIVALSENEGIAQVQYGKVLDENREECFLVDSDFSITGSVELSNVGDTLKGFNRKAGRLFRWCIEDLLHDAMEPEPPS